MKVFCIALHTMWHVAFLTTSITAIILGTINFDKWNKSSSIWVITGNKASSIWVIIYGTACFSYHNLVLLSTIITFVEDQKRDSHNTSLFQAAQWELGTEVNKSVDLSENSVNYSALEHNRMIRRLMVNIVFGVTLLLSVASGCMLTGMTGFSEWQMDLYVVSLLLIMLTCVKMCMCFAYSFAQ